MNEIDEFLRDWSEKKTIEGKTFDELFNIEGIPLWWFYRRFFTPHVMPKQFNTFKLIENNKKLTATDKIKFSSKTKILKTWFSLHEKNKLKHFTKKTTCSSEEKVLFLSYTAHLSKEKEVFRIQRIIDKIKKDRQVKELVLFADPLSSRSYKKLTNQENIYSYYDKTLSNKAKNTAKNLFRKWQKIDQNTKNNLLKSKNYSLWTYLKYSFDFFFSEEFFYILILYYEICKKIIKMENIKIIILTSQSGFFEKCMLAAAKTLNLPSIQIQHGIGLGILDVTYPTKRLVFSDDYKKELIENGLKKENIIVTGPIIFDDIIINKNTNPRKKEKRKKTNILIATGSFIEDSLLSKKKYFKKIKKLLTVIQKINNTSVIIKLHPREKYETEYQKILNELKFYRAEVLQKISRERFYNLIRECDSFINFGSTTAFEAMIIDKPIVTIELISLNKSIFKDNFCQIIKNSGATININYNEDLKGGIEKSLKNEEIFKIKRKEFVKKYCYKVDGKAYERTVDYIYSLINRYPPLISHTQSIIK